MYTLYSEGYEVKTFEPSSLNEVIQHYVNYVNGRELVVKDENGEVVFVYCSDAQNVTAPVYLPDVHDKAPGWNRTFYQMAEDMTNG